MKDQLGRTIDYMRISVTDRCNLRCVYCMPAGGIRKIPHGDVLTFEEICRVAAAAALIGIEKIKITGGEPLVRKNIAELIRGVKQLEGIKKVTLTTNGLLFSEMAEQLAEAGLDAVNFSLDTLDADRYEAITRARALDKVLDAVDLAVRMGLPAKINCVPMKNHNLGDLTGLAGLAKERPLSVRFIEMMPIGLGRNFETVGSEFVLRRIAAAFGEPVASARAVGNGPALYYEFPGFKGSVGFISAMTGEFCGACNRVRLTSDGRLMPCLCNQKSLDLKSDLRNGLPQTELSGKMASFIAAKPRRHNLSEPKGNGAEEKHMVQIGG
jgi:cyclic pyranopterin phosphate synthase